MKSKTLLIFLIFILIFSIIIYISLNNVKQNPIPKNIKSGNLSTDYTIEKALSDIYKFKLNTINIPVVINIENIHSNTMSIDENSKERAIELIKRLKKEDIKIILEPYPWIANGSEYETNWNPSDINSFFWNWKTKILKELIDDIASPYSIDILNIGTSFNHMEYAEGYWIDTIDYVRKYYKGLITYRTSWWVSSNWDMGETQAYEQKLNNKLFSKLDFISIAAYFELTDQDKNSVEEIIEALENTKIFDRGQNVKKEIEDFHKTWSKPIFFGELGFPKTIKALVHPWDPFQSNTIDNMEQANGFEAYKQTFKDEPWFIGFSIFSIGDDSVDKIYYPSDESTTIIRNWYD